MENIYPPVLADSLRPELLAAIGDIVVRWGRLEWQLGNLVVVILDIPKDAGRVLTIGMEIGVVVGVLKTVTHNNHWIKDQKLLIEIRKLATDVRGATEKRHEYAHAVFGIDPFADTPIIARYLFKAAPHRILPSSVPVDIEEMKAIAREAQHFVDTAADLTVRLKASRRTRAAPLLLKSSHRKRSHSPKKRQSRRQSFPT